MDERNIDRVAKGCLKPCRYKHYRTIGSPLSSLLTRNGTLLFAVLAVDYDIYTETEMLIYPWTSLVAEIGGILGLFLGFSFMIVWDGMEMAFNKAKDL